MSNSHAGPARRSVAADRAALALMVIGAERRERLVDRYADGLVLAHGMRLEPARRYAAAFVDEADPYTVLSVGQVWSRQDGKEMPGDAIANLMGRTHDDAFTVEGFKDDMVLVGEGRLMNPLLFRGMWLTAWPAEFDVDGDESPIITPVPVEAADDGEDDQDEERYDPRAVWFMAHRVRDDSLPLGEGIPLLGTHYRAMNWRKPEYKPSYGNALNVVDYLAEHLADYRAGWTDFTAQHDARKEWFSYFNEFGGGCECGIELAAYLGHWLWQRVRSDVVTEYGGTVDDYDVMHMWSPGKADIILAAAPLADPEWRIPPDHPLSQCDGQARLFGVEAA